MTSCDHAEILTICEIINEEKRVKEFICESCLAIFSPCVFDEQIPRTPKHECDKCKIGKKKPKFRIVQEGWQKQLQDYGNIFNKVARL